MKSNPTIFIAEDEETLGEIYSERFKKAGYNVTYFKNGEDLVVALATETPDIILLDMMMPNMNGFSVLETLHNNFQDANKQNIKVVVWSNSESKDSIDKALELGASLYLKKVDFSGQDLVDKVTQLLHNS